MPSPSSVNTSARGRCRGRRRCTGPGSICAHEPPTVRCSVGGGESLGRRRRRQRSVRDLDAGATSARSSPTWCRRSRGRCSAPRSRRGGATPWPPSGPCGDADYGDVFPGQRRLLRRLLLPQRVHPPDPGGADAGAAPRRPWTRSIFSESDAPPYRPAPGDKHAPPPSGAAHGGPHPLRYVLPSSTPTAPWSTPGWPVNLNRPRPPTSSCAGRSTSTGRVFRPLFGPHPHHVPVTIPNGVLTELCTDKLDDPSLSSSCWAASATSTPRPAAGHVAGRPGRAPTWTTFPPPPRHRGVNEWEGSSPTWDTADDLLGSAVDAMRRADPEHEPTGQAARLAAERRAATEAAGPWLKGVARRQFDLALRSATVLSQGRERSKATVIRAIHAFRLAARELARRAVDRGAPDDVRTLLAGDQGRARRLPRRPARLRRRPAGAGRDGGPARDRVPPLRVRRRAARPVDVAVALGDGRGERRHRAPGDRRQPRHRDGAGPASSTTRPTPPPSDRATSSSPPSSTRPGPRCSCPSRRSWSTS